MWGVCVERFRLTVTIFTTRFGAQGGEVGRRGGVATRVRASLQESMVGRLRGGVDMTGENACQAKREQFTAQNLLFSSVTIPVYLV